MHSKKQSGSSSRTYLSPNAIKVHFNHVFATRIIHRYTILILRINNAVKKTSIVLSKYSKLEKWLTNLLTYK